MTTRTRSQLRKYYAVVIIAGVLGAQFWMIVPRGRYNQAWYWPFMNYPMYSAAHHPGDRLSMYELWAGPADASERLRLISSEDLHLTTFKYTKTLRTASGRDGPVLWGKDESASEFLARLVAGMMPGQPLRLQIWERTWTLGRAGLEDRSGVRRLELEWTLGCGPGEAVPPCSGVLP